MFKKISIIIILLTVILLTPIDSFAQGRGGRGGRGGFGGGGGGMMGGFGGGGGGMMGGFGGGGRGGGITPEQLRNSRLLNYLVDSNTGAKIDVNDLNDVQLSTLYERIALGADGDVIDANTISRLESAVNQGMRGNRGGMPQETYDANDTDPNIPVNLSQLDIRAIIETLISWTGKAVIPSPEAMNLTLTVFSPRTMKKSKALSLLYTVMRENGFVAETKDDIIYIKPAPQVVKYDVPLLKPDPNDLLVDFVDRTEIVRKVFRLKNYSPSAMGQIVYPFLDSFGYLTADESTGTLMILDNIETLLKVQAIIKQFDIQLADMVVETVPVQHRDPQEMADLLTTIMSAASLTSSGSMGGFNMMGGMMGGLSPTINITSTNPRQNRGNTRGNQPNGNTRGGTNGRTSTSTPTRGRGSSPMMGGLSMLGSASATAMTVGNAKPEPVFIAEPRNKWIIVRATRDDMETIKQWVAKLDTDAKVVLNPDDLRTIPKNTRVEKFYYLKYNTPQQIAQIVEPLLTESGYISAEENTGTLLVIDTAETLLQIEDIIQQFDVPESDVKDQQIFTIKYGDPREIVEIINLILSGQGTTGSTSRGTTFGTTRTTRNTRTTSGRTTGGFGGRGG